MRQWSSLVPAIASAAGSSARAAHTATTTVRAAAAPIPVAMGIPTTARPSTPIATVPPAIITARQADAVVGLPAERLTDHSKRDEPDQPRAHNPLEAAGAEVSEVAEKATIRRGPRGIGCVDPDRPESTQSPQSVELAVTRAANRTPRGVPSPWKKASTSSR